MNNHIFSFQKYNIHGLKKKQINDLLNQFDILKIEKEIIKYN